MPALLLVPAIVGLAGGMARARPALSRAPPRDQWTGPATAKSRSLNGHFEGGRFIVEESAFHSAAVGLAATGWISALDFQSRLSVLIAPFSRLDQIVQKVPLVGHVIGGTLTRVPVGVSGDIRDPRVVPLGPNAITSELTGMFTRALKLPANILAPLTEKPEAESPPERP